MVRGGANLFAPQHSGNTVAHMVVALARPDRPCLQVLEFLASKAFNFNARNSEVPVAHQGCTPLLLAAVKADLPAVQLLLSKGADANIPSEAGVFPVYEAAAAGSLACFKALAGKTRPEHMWLALHFACLAEDDAVLRHLLDAGDVQALSRRSPLHGQLLPVQLAASNQHAASLRSIYPLVNDPNFRDPVAQNRSLLHFAVASGNPANVRFLLEKGADPEESDAFGVGLVELARASGHSDIASLISGKAAVKRGLREASL